MPTLTIAISPEHASRLQTFFTFRLGRPATMADAERWVKTLMKDAVRSYEGMIELQKKENEVGNEDWD